MADAAHPSCLEPVADPEPDPGWADGSGCANLFNGYCPFHRFAVFLYEDYKPMADAHPCPAGACPHRQPRALWMYETQRLLYNDTARKHDYC